MGEVCGYQLHLYCDHPDHENGITRHPRFAEFYGARNLTQARRAAFGAGWRMRKRRLTTDIGREPPWSCPSCARRPDPTDPEPEPSKGDNDGE